MGTGLNPLGEKQVNFSFDAGADGMTGTQADPAVAALADGDFVVVYENPQAGDSLLAHFFDTSGNGIGPPVSSGLLNGVVDIDPAARISAAPAVTGTPDGGFLVAYIDTSVTSANPVTKVPFEANGIDVRRYDKTTGLSASFVIDTGSGPLHQPNVGTVDDVAIAAFADGTSLVAWDFDFNADPTDDDIYFAFLNSSASGFTTIGGVAHGPRPLTIANGFEGEPSVATTGNLGAIVYAADPGHKLGDQDIILTVFNSAGVQLVPPTTLFGAASLDVFSHPNVAALSDGRFVIVAQDDTTSALVASIFDPVSRVVTPVNLAGLGASGTGPHVAGVPGGGFVLSYDDAIGNIAQARFGPGGSLLYWSSVTLGGAQDQNAVAANTSGTAFFAWQDAGSSNPQSTDADTRIEGEAFRVPPLPQPDFNGDLHSDILWQNASGQAAIWEMNATNIIGGGAVGPNPGPSWKAIGTGDFNGDGHSDILLQSTSGQVAIWEMDGTNVIAGAQVGPVLGPSWKAIGTGDFNGDGHSDILLQSTSGQVVIWEMDGTNVIAGAQVGPVLGPSWKAIGTGDFNGDGHSDILLQNTSGQAAIWEMDGTNVIAGAQVGPVLGPSWKAIGTGDFNGDGHSDILLQSTSGQAAIWEMDGTNVIAGAQVGPNPGPSWELIGARNFKGDDFSDLLWQNANGQIAIWEMHQTTVIGGASVGPNPGSTWSAI
jgi:hypothetical protein